MRHEAWSIKRRASSIEHRASSIQHQASSIKHQDNGAAQGARGATVRGVLAQGAGDGGAAMPTQCHVCGMRAARPQLVGPLSIVSRYHREQHARIQLSAELHCTVTWAVLIYKEIHIPHGVEGSVLRGLAGVVAITSGSSRYTAYGLRLPPLGPPTAVPVRGPFTRTSTGPSNPSG